VVISWQVLAAVTWKSATGKKGGDLANPLWDAEFSAGRLSLNLGIGVAFQGPIKLSKCRSWWLSQSRTHETPFQAPWAMRRKTLTKCIGSVRMFAAKWLTLDIGTGRLQQPTATPGKRPA
jgi:hypothetical protein